MVLVCEICQKFFHAECTDFSIDAARDMLEKNHPYFCKCCLVEQVREPEDSSDVDASEIQSADQHILKNEYTSSSSDEPIASTSQERFIASSDDGQIDWEEIESNWPLSCLSDPIIEAEIDAMLHQVVNSIQATIGQEINSKNKKTGM